MLCYPRSGSLALILSPAFFLGCYGYLVGAVGAVNAVVVKAVGVIAVGVKAVVVGAVGLGAFGGYTVGAVGCPLPWS